MLDLEVAPAKRCLTAAGVLIVDHKVLLIHHRKLNIWLPPGGHVDPNELPHRAAAREFFEETGMRVTIHSAQPTLPSFDTLYLPTPFAINLHWISKKNYEKRLKKNLSPQDASACEQHYTLMYLVKLVGKSHIIPNLTETLDCRWFSRADLNSLNTTQDIKNELTYAFGQVIQ